jgi:hypothetical protein
MSFNPSISDFVSQISKKGLLHANRYILSIDAPEAVLKGAGGGNEDMQYRVADFTLPGKSVSTVETKIYGPVRQAPYAMTYDQATFSLLLSEGLWEREYFERWMNLIVDYESHKVEYANKYLGKMTLSVYNAGGTLTQAYNFVDAFPLALGDVAFAYSNEEPATCQITISYLKYISSMTHENAARSSSDVADLAQSALTDPDTTAALSAGFRGAKKASDRAVKKLENAVGKTREFAEAGRDRFGRSVEQATDARVKNALNSAGKAKERARQFGRSFGNPFGF